MPLSLSSKLSMLDAQAERSLRTLQEALMMLTASSKSINKKGKGKREKVGRAQKSVGLPERMGERM